MINVTFIRQALRDIKTMPLTWWPEFFTKGLKIPKYETKALAYLDEMEVTIRIRVEPWNVPWFDLTMPYRPPKEELGSMEAASRWVAQQLNLLRSQYEYMLIRNYAEDNDFWYFVGWEEREYEG